MHSARYRINQYLQTVLATVAAAKSAAMVMNPALPVGLKDKGPVGLFLSDRGEELIEQSGQVPEKRRAKVVVGAFARTDEEADALHFAARIVMRGPEFRAALSAAAKDAKGNGQAPIFREIEVDAALKEVAYEGSLLLSAFQIEYLETYYSAA